jgi:hypothetical protein
LLELKITSSSGFTEEPIIVARDGDARPTDEPQARHDAGAAADPRR